MNVIKILCLLAILTAADAYRSDPKKRRELAAKIRKEYEKRKKLREEMAKTEEQDKATEVQLKGVLPKPERDGREDAEEEDDDATEAKLHEDGFRTPSVDLVFEGNQYQIHTIMGEPETPTNVTRTTILFLHGTKYDASHWYSSGILPTLRHIGFNVVAADLPGRGRSSPKRPAMESRGQWLLAFMKAANITKPVLVSPTMSGTYAVPAMVSSPESFTGWVAISPSGAKNTTEWEKVTVPTLVMFGAKDIVGHLVAGAMFRALPAAIRFRATNGDMSFYMAEPKTFNTRIVPFLLQGIPVMRKGLEDRAAAFSAASTADSAATIDPLAEQPVIVGETTAQINASLLTQESALFKSKKLSSIAKMRRTLVQRSKRSQNLPTGETAAVKNLDTSPIVPMLKKPLIERVEPSADSDQATGKARPQ